MSVVEATKPLSAVHARRMGVTFLGLRRKAKELKREGILTDDMDKQQKAEILAAAMVADSQDEFEACRAEDGRDWESFFAALIAFIEKIMPLIMMFL
jgi:hypothetical protein